MKRKKWPICAREVMAESNLLYSPNFQDFSFSKSLGVPNNDQRLVKC